VGGRLVILAKPGAFLKFTLLLFVAFIVCGCDSRGGSVPAKGYSTESAALKLRAALSLAVPAGPPHFIPARPSASRRAAAAHPAFFAGEAALSNGVFYLALPNGNPFGYYSYLADPNYAYHFDAGYEYLYDANDGKGGIYLYDFASAHWWYTGRQYPFPYVYDFSLNAFLYYFPDTNQTGHYTANPRYFYNFNAAKIIALPDPTLPVVASVPSLSFSAVGASFAQQFTVSQQQYSGAFVPSGLDTTIATASVSSNTVTVVPVAAGSTSLTITGGGSRSVTVGISVTTLIVPIQ
jgi:hypothetical protein